MGRGARVPASRKSARIAKNSPLPTIYVIDGVNVIVMVIVIVVVNGGSSSMSMSPTTWFPARNADLADQALRAAQSVVLKIADGE